MKLGMTFSHREIQHNGGEPLPALKAAWQLNPSFIRLACYWDEIEPEEGSYIFEPLCQLLNFCEERHQAVVLTVGVKAPRWPEFYWPNWVKKLSPADRQQRLHSYLRKVLAECGGYDCVQVWQIENEPLDPSGPDNQIINQSDLAAEVALVKSQDHRPVLITVWGNALRGRPDVWQQAKELADIVGIDIYPRQFVKTIGWKNWYQGPDLSIADINQMITKLGKTCWVTELQAEPWEASTAAYWQQGGGFLKFVEKHLAFAQQLQADQVLLWGVEFWWELQRQGNTQVWQTFSDLVDIYSQD